MSRSASVLCAYCLCAFQDHYDFGMRAVKSVLVMAGTLKRSNPQLSEDVVLIRAMRDSNLPKFLVRCTCASDASDSTPLPMSSFDIAEFTMAAVYICPLAGGFHLPSLNAIIRAALLLATLHNIRRSSPD
jgi:hypothetical protein